jgi:hypothetical protein
MAKKFEAPFSKLIAAAMSLFAIVGGFSDALCFYSKSSFSQVY